MNRLFNNTKKHELFQFANKIGGTIKGNRIEYIYNKWPIYIDYKRAGILKSCGHHADISSLIENGKSLLLKIRETQKLVTDGASIISTGKKNYEVSCNDEIIKKLIIEKGVMCELLTHCKEYKLHIEIKDVTGLHRNRKTPSLLRCSIPMGLDRIDVLENILTIHTYLLELLYEQDMITKEFPL